MFLGFFLVWAVVYPLAAQEQETPDVPTPGDRKLQPVLPGSTSDLIFVEGEDAVATNFSREPVLNYSTSSYRTLQLNQQTPLQGNAPFYADFVFYVEQDGVYELWYGGTPPGLKDELLPSYSSPFRYVLDGVHRVDVYREDVHVVENYSPAYYWNSVRDVTLSAGQHRIRFEVDQRRRHDNRFFFYFDAFFLLRKENGERVALDTVPEVFPADMDDRTIDHPFHSIEEYEIAIRNNPESLTPYVDLAQIYSLIGDYLNALKNLRRASYLEPDDETIMLLLAKNTTWKGDVASGLELYRKLLEYYPERIDLWTEAGKVAAWTGRFRESIRFFEDGLKHVPDNPGLLVNLGMTYRWSGNEKQAKIELERAAAASDGSPEAYLELARHYLLNDAVDEAIGIYREAIRQHPARVEFYFLLEEAYRRTGASGRIVKLREAMEQIFERTPAFTLTLETFYAKQSMKDQVVKDYEAQLVLEPDNLELRRTLAELYYWNDDRTRAIREYRNILTNEAYRNIRESETSSAAFFDLMDRNYALHNFLGGIPAYADTSEREIAAQLAIHLALEKELAAQQKKPVPASDGGSARTLVADLERRIREERQKLFSLLATKQMFVEKFRTIVSQAEGERAAFDRLLESERSADQAFENLSEGTNWKWDRTTFVDELREVERTGVDLASYVIGRILLAEGNPSGASERFAKLVKEDAPLAGSRYGFFQAELWQDRRKSVTDLLSGHGPEIEKTAAYVPEVVRYLEVLSLADEPVPGYFGQDPAADVRETTAQLESMKMEALKRREQTKEMIGSLHEVVSRRMERSFFRLAQDTYLLRNELGDFLMAEKRFPEAIVQYRQVLSFDPWNIAAMYKLGQVYDFNGDWSKAQELYEKVFWDDPLYGNVASFYNRLAREHADEFGFSGSMYTEPSKTAWTGQAVYTTSLSGTVSLSADYRILNSRDIVENDTPAGSALTHTLSLGLPIFLPGPRLTLTPLIGGILTNGYGNSTASAEALSIGDYGSRFAAYPLAGLKGELPLKHLTVSGNYRYDWEYDSFLPGRDDVSYHQAGGTVAMNLSFIRSPVFSRSTARLLGESRFLSDGNLVYSAGADLYMGFPLALQPEIELQSYLSGSYADALEEDVVDYWSPRNVISVSGGVALRANFPVAGDRLIGEYLRFGIGHYQEDTADATTRSLVLEVENETSYSFDSFSCYLKVGGSMKNRIAPEAVTGDFWSLNVDLGVSTTMPRLLVQ